jgi:hypothetical protein
MVPLAVTRIITLIGQSPPSVKYGLLMTYWYVGTGVTSTIIRMEASTTTTVPGTRDTSDLNRRSFSAVLGTGVLR